MDKFDSVFVQTVNNQADATFKCDRLTLFGKAVKLFNNISANRIIIFRFQINMEGFVDIIQLGARNMQNFMLLKELGRSKKPILLKRGLSATMEEFLMAAEYIFAGGNTNVILCERGIRTFEKLIRNNLDISAVPLVKMFSHLPIIIDPSHAAGRRDMVQPLSRAAIAAGADGLIIEAHNDPAHALCDGAQSLDLNQFDTVMKDIKRRAEFEGRVMMP